MKRKKNTLWKDSPHHKKGDTVLKKKKERHLNEENFMSVSDRCEFPVLFQAKPVQVHDVSQTVQTSDHYTVFSRNTKLLA